MGRYDMGRCEISIAICHIVGRPSVANVWINELSGRGGWQEKNHDIWLISATNNRSLHIQILIDNQAIIYGI